MYVFFLASEALGRHGLEPGLRRGPGGSEKEWLAGGPDTYVRVRPAEVIFLKKARVTEFNGQKSLSSPAGWQLSRSDDESRAFFGLLGVGRSWCQALQVKKGFGPFSRLLAGPDSPQAFALTRSYQQLQQTSPHALQLLGTIMELCNAIRQQIVGHSRRTSRDFSNHGFAHESWPHILGQKVLRPARSRTPFNIRLFCKGADKLGWLSGKAPDDRRVAPGEEVWVSLALALGHYEHRFKGAFAGGGDGYSRLFKVSIWESSDW